MRKLFTIVAALLLCPQPVQAQFLTPSFYDDEYQPEELPPPTELIIGLTQYPGSLNPMLDSSVVQSYVHGFVRQPFTVYDSNWTLQCILCTTVPTLENGLAKIVTQEDGNTGMEVRYSIRPDAYWGDGTAVTTDDVLFTWSVGRNPAVGSIGLQSFQEIDNITAHNTREFTLHYKTVRFDYNEIGGFFLLPAHIETIAYDGNPERYRQQTRYDSSPTDAGLYNGPYRIAALEAGTSITLERNSAWRGQEPQFERIILRTISNTSSLEANLLSNTIHMIAGEVGLDFDKAASFAERYSSTYQIVFKPSLLYEHIDVNLDNPVLADVRVRKALMYAMNRTALNDYGFSGRLGIAHSPVNPLDTTHTPAVHTYDYDPDKANALLEEAGWKRGRGGFRYNDKEERLRLTFSTTSGNRARELVQQVLQNSWRQVGIDVVLQNKPARVLFGEILKKRDFTGLVLYAWSSAPGKLPKTTLHSDYIPSEANAYAGQNYSGYANPRMDTLLTAMEQELDAAKRQQSWAELQQIYADDLPSLPLYFRSTAFILPLTFRGLEPTGHQFPSSLWVTQWRWEP